MLFNGAYLEILGCGFIHETILSAIGSNGKYLAFGLGLDRLAMILFNIPDIRYMWALEDKFLNQFSTELFALEQKITFVPFSNLDSICKDISFYISADKIGTTGVWVEENNFFEMIREIAPEYIESVEMKDEFFSTRHNKLSRMYRLSFSPTASDINVVAFNKRCNEIMISIGDALGSLGLEIR